MEKLFLIAYVVVVHHPEEDTLDLNLNWTEIGAKLKKEMKWFQKDNSYYLHMYLYDYENEYYVFYKYFRKNIINW